ncbi:hypothetical protein [Pseudomonas lundensis]|nr:hypothetical protein [Pseudomonas lundensis]
MQGQYHDHETVLHYNQYRYYDPRGGRLSVRIRSVMRVG